MQRRASWIVTVVAAGLALFLIGAGGGDTISGAEAQALVKKGALLLDVRTPEEFSAKHVDGAVNIPVDELGARLKELEGKKDGDVVVYCHSGRRSAMAKTLLTQKGFKKVHDLGAMANWSKGP